ncbi:MAG: DUF1593 domain-containing protein [Candidatus Omnitrophota bacterium]|jgi:hypothetical protein|nr:MAG: DUF1593 domain-containing protein [Candidatus Omnitrophota bacterium]
MNGKPKLWIIIGILILIPGAHADECEHGALAGERYRVIVSTDIGGSDPDDFQSMIHFLMYADLFDIEGLISSPWDKGRKEHILQVIDRYEMDYLKLKTHSDRFPTPAYLRSITKQGEIERAPSKGYRTATEGSNWIIRCAKKDDPRPLYLLVWGLPEDVAQALHDAPEILKKIRVIFIGGPNKKWGANAYDYIERNFPDLWMIENNSSYRGFFVGGNQSGDWGNTSFYENHIKGHGALGEYFGNFRTGNIKMGDTPTVTYLLCGDPENPTTDSWGGRFQPAPYRPKFIFNRQTNKEDLVEVFSIVEWNFTGPNQGPALDEIQFDIIIDEQKYDGYYDGDGLYRFRWSPKSVGTYAYTIYSSLPFLHRQTGEFTCVAEGALGHRPHEIAHKNWWTDILNPAFREGAHSGAKTTNPWREKVLRDWQNRLDWIQ